MKLVNPDRPLDDVGRERVAAIVARQRKANGHLMTAINFVGGQVEDALKVLPKGARDQIDTAARAALKHSYNAASRSRAGIGQRVVGDGVHRTLATLSGALGGLGGLPTALAELPVATTLIFRAVQGVASSYGEDPLSEETRLECLRVFGAGGPTADDDGVNTSFFGARLSLTGPALQGVLAKVAPRFAAVLTQKLAAQAVPLIGAAAGAGTNYAFTDYYTAMAHVHFGLRALCREYDDGQTLDEFHRQLALSKVPVTRA
jgi:hypothetical protein